MQCPTGNRPQSGAGRCESHAASSSWCCSHLMVQSEGHVSASVVKSTELQYLSKITSNTRKSYLSKSKSTCTKFYLSKSKKYQHLKFTLEVKVKVQVTVPMTPPTPHPPPTRSLPLAACEFLFLLGGAMPCVCGTTLYRVPWYFSTGNFSTVNHYFQHNQVIKQFNTHSNATATHIVRPA